MPSSEHRKNKPTFLHAQPALRKMSDKKILRRLHADSPIPGDWTRSEGESLNGALAGVTDGLCTEKVAFALRARVADTPLLRPRCLQLSQRRLVQDLVPRDAALLAHARPRRDDGAIAVRAAGQALTVGQLGWCLRVLLRGFRALRCFSVCYSRRIAACQRPTASSHEEHPQRNAMDLPKATHRHGEASSDISSSSPPCRKVSESPIPTRFPTKKTSFLPLTVMSSSPCG